MDWLDIPPLPEVQQSSSPKKAVITRCQKQTIRLRPVPSSRSAHSLHKGRNRRGGIDLDDSVEIADIEAQFKRARRHDDAVLLLSESMFRRSALLDTERTVRNECLNLPFPEKQGQLFHSRPAIAEYQTLLSPVQQRDDLGCIFQRVNVVELHLGGLFHGERRRDNLSLPLRAGGKPFKHLVW